MLEEQGWWRSLDSLVYFVGSIVCVDLLAMDSYMV